MEILAIIAIIAVLISHKSLSSRLDSLESKLKSGALVKGTPEFVAVPPSQPAVPQTVMHGGMEEYVGQLDTIPATPATAIFSPAQPRQPDASERFGAWLKEDWLMKLGAFIFIIGCGWFVSYAFASDWIGPVGRISIGIIAGVLVMAFGFWRMMRFPSQGAVFMALGAGMAILTIFAGTEPKIGELSYGFFTPVAAVCFDFIIIAFVSFASYKFNIRSLALIAQILAFVSPLLTAGKTDSIFLFTYLLFISLATLVLAGLMGWRGLILSSLVFVGMYSFPNMYSADAPILLNFAYIFAMLYLLSGMFAVVRKGVESAEDAKNELVLAVLNGLFLLLWIYGAAEREMWTLIFSAWAIVFAVGSFIAFRLSSKLHPFYAYGSVAVAFIAAATAAQLNGETLTIALTIEVLVLVAALLALTKSIGVASSALLLFFAPIMLSFASMMRYSQSKELFTGDFFVLFVLALSLIFAGRLIGNVERGNATKESSPVWMAAVIFGTVYVWFLIWSFMHILLAFAPDIATFVTLVIYTVAGLWAYFDGLYGNDTARRVYGTALLVFVVARLLFVDVWAMELFGRVITFFAIGILLMSTAFLTKRKATQ